LPDASNAFRGQSVHVGDPLLLCRGLCQDHPNSRWVLIDVMVRNQHDEKVATGEAMVEFPLDAAA